MKLRLWAGILLGLSTFARADVQSVSQFRGLNNADSSILIGDSQAQSLQDVDITPSGNGIKKRSGYTLFKSVGVSTSPIRGGYYFRDTSGNDEIIHTNNRSIYKSVAGAAYSAFVTTDTIDSFYDFTDSQGYLWRANSNRDRLLRYDGTTVTYYPSAPLGDQVEALSDRLVVSGVTANPNRLYFSAAADFTDFATGILETSAFTEDIGLPGQKINAIKVACGSNVMVWTRDTTSMFTAQNQFDLSPVVNISNTIGTLQPYSVIQDLGITYWQGQDKHFYSYDCNSVQKLSQELDVSGFAGGESKIWTQTAQADWDAGTKAQVTSAITVGDVNLSTWTQTDTTTADFTAGATSGTYISSNSVYPSTSSDTDTTTADFVAGTLVNISTAMTSGRIYFLPSDNSNVLNNSFETVSDWDAGNAVGYTNSPVKSGSKSMQLGTTSSGGSFSNFKVSLLDSGGSTILQTSDLSGSLVDDTWVQFTVNITTQTGQQVKMKFSVSGAFSYDFQSSALYFCSSGPFTFWAQNHVAGSQHALFIDLIEGGRGTQTSGSIVSTAYDSAFTSAAWLSSGATGASNGQTMVFETQSSSDNSSWNSLVAWSTGSAPASSSTRYLRYKVSVTTSAASLTALPYIDDVTLAGMANPAKFTSQSFNTAFSTAGWLSSGANWVLNSHAISMQTQASSDGSSWDSAVSWSTGSAPTSAGKQYIRYVATFSTGTSTDSSSLPHLDDATFSARAASGTFTSQTKNIGSNATSFGNFSADQTLNSGTIGYFIRTATTEGGLASASWTALTRDAQISASINPWIQVKATFTITAATQDPSLQNFTVAWNEGSLAKTFGSVDKDHRLMWSVAEGTATVSSATYIYDLRFKSWLKYSVPFDAPARVGDSIYFGNPSSGNVYTWPSGTSDNGSAITAFWKSKDFIGGDPFSEKDFINYSIVAKAQTGSTLDIGYTINTSSSISNNFSLTDSNSSFYRRINSNFPSGKFGTFINFRFGNDDADAPFEVYGFKFDYKPRPWRVLQ